MIDPKSVENERRAVYKIENRNIKKGHVDESCSLNVSCYIIFICFILHIQPTLLQYFLTLIS